MDDEIMNKIQVILTTTDAKIKGGQMRSKKLSKYAKSISLKQFYKIASFDIWSGMGRRPPVAKCGYGQGACPPVS